MALRTPHPNNVEVGALVFHLALDHWITEDEERALADVMEDVLGLVSG